MTVGLHWYKGMIVSLAIQSVMGPFGLFDNVLVRAVLFSSEGLSPDAKLFHEKTVEELTTNDEVVDQHGNPVTVKRPPAGKIADKPKVKTLEEIMLDTWDAGAKADLSQLMKALNRKNCNFQTKEDRWTPLMVLSGLGENLASGCDRDDMPTTMTHLSCPLLMIGVSGAPSAIRQVLELGADPSTTDAEGWTALHWAAFHGQVESAKVLAGQTKLLSVKDKDGNTPIDMARKEGNDKVAEIYELAAGESKKSK